MEFPKADLNLFITNKNLIINIDFNSNNLIIENSEIYFEEEKIIS